jgi:hypothetical protein
MPAVARKKALPPMSILDPLSEPESIAFPETARKPRKSLSEMAAGNDSPGLVCHNCGCRDFRVARVKPKPGRIQRQRICRHCGTPKVTFEQDAFGK